MLFEFSLLCTNDMQQILWLHFNSAEDVALTEGISKQQPTNSRALNPWMHENGALVKKNNVALEHSGLKIQILYFEKLR